MAGSLVIERYGLGECSTCVLDLTIHEVVDIWLRAFLDPNRTGSTRNPERRLYRDGSASLKLGR